MLLKTRVRDVEETLLSLINDEDQVVAAAAIDLVEERGLWTLASDLEQLFAYRNASDRYVFEAASWTLAAHRMPDSRRRSLWLEPLPVVELAEALRKIPLFSSVSVDELFRVAALGRQVRLEEGHVLYHEGAVPTEVQFLLDGGASARSSRGGESREVLPPAPLGLEPLLEGSVMPETIRTLRTSVCLAISAEELRALVSDNSDLVRDLFRMLVTGDGVAARTVLEGLGGVDDGSLAPSKLTPIERTLVLETIPLFHGITAEEMLNLASIAQEAPLTEGASPIQETDPPALLLLIAGRLSLQPTNGAAALVAGGGDVVGLYETLSGVPLGRSGVVLAGGRALRIDGEELFDLLGQRPALLQQLFAALFRARVAASTREKTVL